MSVQLPSFSSLMLDAHGASAYNDTAAKIPRHDLRFYSLKTMTDREHERPIMQGEAVFAVPRYEVTYVQSHPEPAHHARPHPPSHHVWIPHPPAHFYESDPHNIPRFAPYNKPSYHYHHHPANRPTPNNGYPSNAALVSSTPRHIRPHRHEDDQAPTIRTNSTRSNPSVDKSPSSNATDTPREDTSNANASESGRTTPRSSKDINDSSTWKKPMPKFGRSRKDPTAPKHPLSPFIFYLKETRARCSAQYSGLGMSQIMKMLSSRWNTMSDDEKAPYIDMSRNDQERYAKEMDEWMRDKMGLSK